MGRCEISNFGAIQMTTDERIVRQGDELYKVTFFDDDNPCPDDDPPRRITVALFEKLNRKVGDVD